MPGNPTRMLHRTRLEEQELKVQAELYHLNQLHGHPLPRRTNIEDTRLGRLLVEIYSMFVDYAETTGKPQRMPANTLIDALRKNHSNTTINKAKKLLGIVSIRRGGLWYWRFPRVAPSQAFVNQHLQLVKDYDPAQDQIRLLHKPAAKELMAIMEDNNYEIQNKIAIQLMANAGYKRSTTLVMKAGLGIINGRKVGDRIIWYWPNRTVQDWLEKKLENGPRPHQQLAQEAWEEHSWSYELIHWARKAMPYIELRVFDRVGHWMDINHQKKGGTERVVEVDNTPVYEDESVIVVDFSAEEEPEHDLSPEPDKVDDPAVTSHTIRVGGAKIEVFE